MDRYLSLCLVLARHMPAPSQLHLESWRIALAWLCTRLNINCLLRGLITSIKALWGELRDRLVATAPFSHPQELRHMPVGWWRCQHIREGAVAPPGEWSAMLFSAVVRWDSAIVQGMSLVLSHSCADYSFSECLLSSCALSKDFRDQVVCMEELKVMESTDVWKHSKACMLQWSPKCDLCASFR